MTWSTGTPWFTVALVMSIFAVGSVCFGRFEQHKPRWRRVLKQVVVLALMLTLEFTLGRAWVYGVLTFMGVVAAVIHLWWLPKHGINGWTAEPYEKYLALITRR